MIDIIEKNWEQILLNLKEEHEISDISFKTWLLPLKPYSFKNNTVTIIVPEQTFLAYVKRRYSLLMKVAISEFLGVECEIEFKLEDQLAEANLSTEPQLIEKNNTSVSPDVIQSANLNPKYTFDTFVVGSNNNLAHAAALAVAESPGEIYNPLFIYGGVGLGKTHLMHAIAHFILKNTPTSKILYVSSETFTNELIDAIRNKNNITTTEFREKYRNNDVLLIDDIQFIIGKESTQEEFFHTFNSLHDAHKQIVIASDRPAKEIKSLEERLRTRFEWGLTADVQPPDFETRVAIVKRKAELLHLDLPEDVAEFIANHLKNNIRQLEGAVKKLNAYYMLEGIQPVISVAQNAIKDILNETQPVPVTIEKIIGEVSRTFNVSPADIRGTKRNANVASARRVAIYILREVTGMSMEEIGREFSGRDHSTIVYSLKTMERDMKNDQHLRETVSDIIKNVKA